MVQQLSSWNRASTFLSDRDKKPLPVAGGRNILITSALPYVNNVPHLGNIIGCVLSADVFARYARLRGHQTLYICGTDEYGTATETKALQLGLTPKEVCDKFHQIHKEIYEWFNIDFDNFGRTSTPEQTEICQDIFLKLHANGFTSTETIDQLHCETCNKFLADRYVNGICPSCGYDDARGDQCDSCGKLINAVELKSPKCHVCKSEPKIKQSEHVFLCLDKLQPEVAEYIDKQLNRAESRWSSNAIAITKGWLKQGLDKRCITRDLKWGIPVPLENFSEKVFYVWYDAPIGYLSITKALLGSDWVKWWKNPMNVELYNFLGKDNVAFHAVMFPCSQLGARDNYTIVNNMCATEYLNYEDTKFSKSRNTGVFGDTAKETGIDADVWRFYLLYMRPESQDTSFCWDDFALKVNSELLANLGNFINRALTFIKNNFESKIQEMILNESDLEFLQGVETELKEWDQLMDAVKLKDALKIILSISRRGNVYMQGNAPWDLFKGTDDQKKRAGTVVSVVANVAYMLSLIIHPFMPRVSEQIREQCGLKAIASFIPNVVCYLKTGHTIGEPKPLFVKIEKAKIDDLKVRFGGTTTGTKGSPVKDKKQTGKSQKEKNGALLKMTTVSRNFPNLAKNRQQIDKLYYANKTLLEQARQLFVSQKLSELKFSNAELEKEIIAIKEKLVAAEVTVGVKQYSVPSFSTTNIAETKTVESKSLPEQKTKVTKAQPEKKAAAGEDKRVTEDDGLDIGRLDLRVGRIIHCEKHPDADSLYLEKIDVGEAEPRTVVSGLVKHVPLDQMQNRLVVVLCNLKPAKMRGVESKAMVMCASCPEKVEIMEVDPDLKPGASVTCPPFVHRPDAQLNPKKKIWETVAEHLLVSADGIATWKGHPLLVDGASHMTAPTLRNVHVK